MTAAERKLLEAARAWAAAERRLRDTTGFYEDRTSIVVDAEEKHRINLQCDVTEQNLLDADAAVTREKVLADLHSMSQYYRSPRF